MPLTVASEAHFPICFWAPAVSSATRFLHHPVSLSFVPPWVSLICLQLFKNLGKGSSRLHQQMPL